MTKDRSENLILFGYVVMAVLQVVATWQGVQHATDLPRAIALVGGSVGAVPILGSVTAMWGAMTAWGWSFLLSLLVFFWYVPAVVIAAAFGAARNEPA